MAFYSNDPTMLTNFNRAYQGNMQREAEVRERDRQRLVDAIDYVVTEAFEKPEEKRYQREQDKFARDLRTREMQLYERRDAREGQEFDMTKEEYEYQKKHIRPLELGIAESEHAISEQSKEEFISPDSVKARADLRQLTVEEAREAVALSKQQKIESQANTAIKAVDKLAAEHELRQKKKIDSILSTEEEILKTKADRDAARKRMDEDHEQDKKESQLRVLSTLSTAINNQRMKNETYYGPMSDATEYYERIRADYNTEEERINLLYPSDNEKNIAKRNELLAQNRLKHTELFIDNGKSVDTALLGSENYAKGPATLREFIQANIKPEWENFVNKPQQILERILREKFGISLPSTPEIVSANVAKAKDEVEVQKLLDADSDNTSSTNGGISTEAFDVSNDDIDDLTTSDNSSLSNGNVEYKGKVSGSGGSDTEEDVATDSASQYYPPHLAPPDHDNTSDPNYKQFYGPKRGLGDFKMGKDWGKSASNPTDKGILNFLQGVYNSFGK